MMHFGDKGLRTPSMSFMCRKLASLIKTMKHVLLYWQVEALVIHALLFTMDDPRTFKLHPTMIPVTWWLCLQRIAITKTTVTGGVDRAVIMLDKYLASSVCVCVHT